MTKNNRHDSLTEADVRVYRGLGLQGLGTCRVYGFKVIVFRGLEV